MQLVYQINSKVDKVNLEIAKYQIACILSVSVDNPPPCNDSLIPLVVGPRHPRHRGAGHQLYRREQDRPG